MSLPINRARGFVHDIEFLSGLSDEPCNVRLLSDRSLYVMQNLASKDVGFYARYGTIIDQGQYIPVENGTTNAELVDTTQDLIRKELQDLSLEQGLIKIADAIEFLALNQCCPSDGSGGSGENEGSASSGQDNGVDSPDPTKWPTYQEYKADKCNRATGIINQFQEDINNFEQLNWVGLLALPIGEALILLAATLITPIPGDEILGVLAVISTLAGGVLPVVAVVKSSIVNVKDDLICNLYEAPDVSTAKADSRATLQAEIDAQSSGIVQAAASLMGNMFLTNNSLNKLFDPDALFDYPTADCSNCAQQGDEDWNFEFNQEGWTFSDDSNVNGSAQGVYDAAGEALRTDFQYNTSPNATGLGRWTSPVISFPITSLPRVTVEHNAPSDAIGTAISCFMQFQSSPQEFKGVVVSSAGTAVLNFTTNDTVVGMFIQVGRSNGPVGGPAVDADMNLERITLTNQ